MESGFVVEGDVLVPSSSVVGPWSDEMVGGRFVSGLLAWAVERDLGSEQRFRVARMTVDMFRPIPMRPLRVTTRTIRDGRRVRMLEASVWHGDVEVSKASALMLFQSSHPRSSPWAPEDGDMPTPESLPSGPNMPGQIWEYRMPGQMGQGRGRVWIRELQPLVAGSQVTPLIRAMAASDFVNPLVNSGETGLEFINADVTVYLSRYPLGDWVGLEALGHLGAGGIAMAAAWLWDSEGRFGQCLAAATPDPRIGERTVARAGRERGPIER